MDHGWTLTSPKFLLRFEGICVDLVPCQSSIAIGSSPSVLFLPRGVPPQSFIRT
ncbi:unnamed protein product [Cyprideis torosa]|uniref:Uncharacterized protein n=1 Tax=Cyprideis torosa TaxID=163714 RepID=A0A7R8WJT5_9CRUS|nr:unnamed protein product [Cyprideis torosa]CAG0902376.1 unnamed protein product [Cyprideis torosa]